MKIIGSNFAVIYRFMSVKSLPKFKRINEVVADMQSDFGKSRFLVKMNFLDNYKRSLKTEKIIT